MRDVCPSGGVRELRSSSRAQVALMLPVCTNYNRFNRDRFLSSFHLDHVIHFFNFFSIPFNFFRWYSAGCKRLGPPGLPSCSCGLRPQGLGLCSARRAGQQCASARSRNPKVVRECVKDSYSSPVQYPQSLSLR
jgi:hypothetical protein